MEILLKKPKTARGEASLKKIINSTKHLIGENGYHSTTVEDIMKNANMATGTFYIYFKDKMSAYEYCLQDIQKEIRNNLSQATKYSKTRLSAEKVGLKAFLIFIKNNKHAYSLIWQSQHINPTLFENYYMSFSKRYIKNLQKAIDSHEIYDYDLEILSFTLMGIANFIGLRYLLFNEDTDIDELVDQVTNILQTGVFKPVDSVPKDYTSLLGHNINVV